MNLTLVRDGFEREETPYTRDRTLIAGTMSAGAAAGCRRRTRWCAAFIDSACSAIAAGAAQPRSIIPLVTLSATLIGFVLGALFGSCLALMIVHSARAGEKPAAVDHLLADGADPGAGADLHRGARRARAARACCRNRSSRPICASSRSRSAW